MNAKIVPVFNAKAFKNKALCENFFQVFAFNTGTIFAFMDRYGTGIYAKIS